MLLTLEDIGVLLESIKHSVQRISEYPHHEYSHKQKSLAPLIAIRDKLIQYKAEIGKGAPTP